MLEGGPEGNVGCVECQVDLLERGHRSVGAANREKHCPPYKY